MRMSADHNWNFSYGGVFPQSFSNRNVVSLQPETMNNDVTDLTSEGTYASVDVSSMAGMILPCNPVTQSNTSSRIQLPGNLSGNIMLDPVPALNLSSAASASWSLEELYVLRQGLIQYATEPTSIMKYIKIAAKLPEKTVRDVAMRCRWIAESGKRRKLGSYHVEKKEMVVYSSSLSTVPSVQPKDTTYSSLRMYDVPTNNQPNPGASPVNTERQRLLMENFNLLNQIGTNLELSKLEDNINLFYRTRVNLTTVLNRMSGKPGMMSQMPPLPVFIDDNLFQSILPLARQVL